MKNLIVIDNEIVEVENITTIGIGKGALLDCGNQQYYIFPNKDEAGIAAREYYENMAKNDPEEFMCIVGKKALVSWCLNQPYAVGSTSTKSLDEWLDLWLDTPEDHFSTYDGETIDIYINNNLKNELGFGTKTCVAYRSN